MLTLLGKAGFIHDQDAVGIAQFRRNVATQVIADGIGVPGIAIQHPLDATRMVVARLLRSASGGPAVLPFHLGQQAAQVIGGMLVGFGSNKVWLQQRYRLIDNRGCCLSYQPLVPTDAVSRNHDLHLLLPVYL